MKITEHKTLSSRRAFLMDGGHYRNGQAWTLYFPVKILDTRRAFGRREVLIAPAGGGGQTWVNESRLTDKLPDSQQPSAISNTETTSTQEGL